MALAQQTQLRKITRKWLKEEEMVIASYIAEHYNRFKCNKMELVRQMIDKLQLRCHEKQLKNKVDAMEKNYKATKAKYENTGEELKEDELEYRNFEERMLFYCPWFKVFDSVMGNEPVTTPFYTSDTTSETFGDCSALQFVETDDDMAIDEMSEASHFGDVQIVSCKSVSGHQSRVKTELGQRGKDVYADSALAEAILEQCATSERIEMKKIELKKYKFDKRQEYKLKKLQIKSQLKLKLMEKEQQTIYEEKRNRELDPPSSSLKDIQQAILQAFNKVHNAPNSTN